MFRKLPLILAAVAVSALTASAQYTVSGPGTAVFPPAAGGTGGGGDNQTMLPTQFSLLPLTTPVPAGASNIKSVTLTGLTHTWSGDVQAVLWNPGMTQGYNLVVRLGLAAPAACCGYSADYNGNYTFVPAGDPSINSAWPLTNVSPVTGVYPQEYGLSYGSGWISGSANVFNTDIALIPIAAGTWTLALYDGAGGDTGTLTGWSMSGDTGPSFTPYCFGDGSGVACPCANNGVAGNGCANSIVAAGANLAASGTASISADTLVLTGSNMPNSSALYFQGTAQIAAGAGVAFGDGKRCVAGTIARLGTKTNVGGTSQYPTGADLVISVRGSNAAGNVRDYQVWYRNADPSFCTPATFNLSNGVELTWIP